MARVNSICAMVSVMVSMMVAMMASGCAHADSRDPSTAENQPSADESGYSYVMAPLQLNSNAPAPTGEALLPNGRVSPEEVLRQAMARLDGLRTCYTKALASDPKLAGQMQAHYKFEASGELSSFEMKSDLALTPEFKDCVKSTLSTMRMPATKGGTMHVEYPIALDPAAVAAR